MTELPLQDKIVLITGAGRRIGRALALACAAAGANVIVHFLQSGTQAKQLQQQITSLGRTAWLVQADLGNEQGVSQLIQKAWEVGSIYALVNNAAVFEPLFLQTATYAAWNRHLAINLSAPFLLTQAFAARVPADGEGRIVNILDWRAFRPGADHFPYSVSKAALAALTRGSAAALAPRVAVNGLALGAILPPEAEPVEAEILDQVPVGRWGALSDVEAALLFLLSGASYITGEIIHVDGGRHLT